MIGNYHTHTLLCGHASGTLSDYCREAVRLGMDVLGFSDHCPWPDGLWREVRMDMSELDDYFRMIGEAEREFPGLEVRRGLECEFREDLGSFLPDTFSRPGRAEYILLAVHAYLDETGRWHDAWNIRDPRELIAYARHAARALESGWFTAFAHPDIFACGGCPRDDSTAEAAAIILRAAADCRIPLEINCNGLRKGMIRDASGQMRLMYPYRPFWEMAADYDVRVFIGADAHTPGNLGDKRSECLALAAECGLQVVETLPMRRS